MGDVDEWICARLSDLCTPMVAVVLKRWLHSRSIHDAICLAHEFDDEQECRQAVQASLGSFAAERLTALWTLAESVSRRRANMDTLHSANL